MKKNIGKRILSLALALVMVVGLLPMTALKAYAAPSEAETIPTSNTGKHAYSENLTVYYKHDNYLYKVVFSNIKDLDKVGLCFSSSSILQLAGSRGLYLAPTSGTTDMVYISNFPTQTGSSVSFYLRNSAPYAVNINNPVVTVTCMGAGNPTWSWNGTSSATAVFTSTDGNATMTVGAEIKSAEQAATNCLEKGKVIYTATATCNGQAYTDTKTVDGAAGPHSYTYSASGDTLTETCSNNCGYSAEATLQLKSGTDLTYTGSPITPMEMVYPEGWAGEKKQPADTDYEDNVNAGTNTASCSFTYADDATVEKTFSIEPASLSECIVTMTPASGTYTGSVHNRPTYTLTYNGKQLVEGTDYIVDANWSGDFTNVGSCNLILKGKGNFTGYKSLTYTIGKGTPTKEMFVVQWPQEPVYDGTTKFPVTVTPKTTDLGEITAVKYNGSTDVPVNAGTYKVTVDVAESENYNAIYNLELGSFTVAPAAGSIIIPANQSVVYDGAAVEQSDLTPAITTDGALTVKWYDSEGTEITAPTDVGTYQIGISAAAGSNYNAVEEVKQTFTITKADPICTAPTAIAGLVYNGKEKTLIYSAESLDGIVYYSLDGSNYTESLPKGTNAQEYTVYYKVVGDANHNDMEPKTVTATIAPLNIGTVSIKGGVLGDSFTYNGQEHTPDVQIDVSIPSGEANVPSTEVRLAKDTDYTVAYSNNVNAGEAVVTFTGKGNYTGTITKNFTIDPKELDGSAVSIPDMSLPYTGEAQTVAIVVPEGVTYELVEGTMTATNVAMYGFTIQFTGNHTGMTSQGWQITAVAPNATAPTANTLTYNGEDQALIAAGATNDGTMVYSLEKEGEYKAELPKAKTAGTYHVWYKVIGDGNHTDSAPASVEVKIDKVDPGIGAVTAGVVNDTLETSAIVLTRENTDIDGTLTVDAEQTLAWGDNTIRYTFTPEDTTNYKVVKGEVAVTVVDTIAPVGTVTVSTKSWAEFLNNITFGLFFKETQTVSVTASDNLSGVVKIEYIESKTALDLEAVKAATQWTEMKNGSVSVTLEDTKQFVYYIRITDKAGNVAYLSSDGAEYDTAAPVIAGVDNGVTYYTTQKVTVTDKNIDTITLNGEAATGSIALEGNKAATYTIVATDKAGNETTVTVTMKPIKALAEATENRGNDNVTSADAPALEALVEKLDELLADEDVSEDGEKETLEQHKVVAESLLQTIEEHAAEQKAVTDEAAEYDKDAVKSTDKAGLEALEKDIEDLLDTENLTQDERAALEALLEGVEDMIDTINATAADKKIATDAVDSCDPATVTSKDKAAIESAREIMEDLLDTKHLTDTERDALEKAKADAETLLEIIDEAAKAADTDNTAKVENVTTDNVTPEDRSDLEKAKADLEDALENSGGNYTEEEKKAIADEIKRIEDALEIVENVEAAEEVISKLPATVEPDDEEAVAKIGEAQKIYDELTEYEKSLIDDKTKKKLDDLSAAAVAYDIVKGDGGKWTKGSSSDLSFTANGLFSKFVGIEVDGKKVDEKYYDAKAGSTIITLKQSYLNRLSTGEHTITAVYTDGETSGTFKVLTESSVPATGDNSNILLYSSMLMVSLAGLVVLLLAAKKRKQETA